MAKFKKGNSGRPKGAKNKTTKLGKDKMSDFLNNGGYDTLIEEIGELDGYAKVQAILKVMEFVVPKLKAIELNANIQDQREDRTLEEIEAEMARLNAINEKDWPDFTDD